MRHHRPRARPAGLGPDRLRGRRARRRAGRAARGRPQGGQGRLVHLARADELGEGGQALRDRLPGREGRGAAHRLAADPAADDAGAPGQHQERGRGPHLRRRPLRAAEGEEAPDALHPGRGRPLRAGFKDQDGYHYGLRATVNVIAYNTKEVPAAEAPRTWKDLLDPKWRGQARHRASRLQRGDRDPRAGPRAPARLGLLQGARPEQAHARAVGGGSVRASWPPGSGRSRPTAATTPSTSSRRRAIRWRSSSRRRACRSSSPRARSRASRRIRTRPGSSPTSSSSREIQQVLADTEGLYTGHPDGEVPGRPAEARRTSSSCQVDAGGAREAQRGDQDALRRVLRRLTRPPWPRRWPASRRPAPRGRRARPRRAGLAARGGRAASC